MSDTKLTFPKLKCFSERQTNILNKYANMKIKTISSQPTKTQINLLTLNQRINTIKIKYVNKSPNYFRHKNRSSKSIQYQSQKNTTIAQYLQEKGKRFDKQQLLEVAKSRAKKARLQQHDTMKKEKEKGQTSTIVQQNETRYSHFRPSRIPIKHAIKSMQHIDLTIPIRL